MAPLALQRWKPDGSATLSINIPTTRVHDCFHSDEPGADLKGKGGVKKMAKQPVGIILPTAWGGGTLIQISFAGGECEARRPTAPLLPKGKYFVQNF